MERRSWFRKCKICKAHLIDVGSVDEGGSFTDWQCPNQEEHDKKIEQYESEIGKKEKEKEKYESWIRSRQMEKKDKKVSVEIALDNDTWDILDRVAKKMKEPIEEIVETILRNVIIQDVIQKVHEELDKKAKKPKKA
jgi:hypothetical protein